MIRTIGELIAELAKHDRDKRVVFDFCNFEPTGGITSYRGNYAYAALNYQEETSENTISCGHLRENLEKRIGTTMHGWKGGEYPVAERTPIWVANPDRSTGTLIEGITDHGKFLVISTKYYYSSER